MDEITSRGTTFADAAFSVFLVLFSKKIEDENPSKNCDSQGRTRWYWYRWFWKLRGFNKNSVHPWRMWES